MYLSSVDSQWGFLSELLVDHFDDFSVARNIDMRDFQIIYTPQDCALFPVDDLVCNTLIIGIDNKSPRNELA